MCLHGILRDIRFATISRACGVLNSAVYKMIALVEDCLLWSNSALANGGQDMFQSFGIHRSSVMNALEVLPFSLHS